MGSGACNRPVLRWHGGKWKLAPWILAHFPDHRIYVEPFGGAASVLLRKPRSYAEIYNDLDGDVVNLFRVLRSERHPELIRALRLTPFAREEFQAAYEHAEDAVEEARRLIIRSFMGRASDSSSGGRGSAFRANSNQSGTSPAQDWANYPDALERIVERWRGVVVESRPALEVMAQHDGPQTLHYVDPPYVWSTRSSDKAYRHEMADAEHTALLEALLGLEGAVILSGYPSALYDDALSHWRRFEREAHADGARERTEVIWMNRDPPNPQPVQLSFLGEQAA